MILYHVYICNKHIIKTCPINLTITFRGAQLKSGWHGQKPRTKPHSAENKTLDPQLEITMFLALHALLDRIRIM